MIFGRQNIYCEGKLTAGRRHNPCQAVQPEYDEAKTGRPKPVTETTQDNHGIRIRVTSSLWLLRGTQSSQGLLPIRSRRRTATRLLPSNLWIGNYDVSELVGDRKSGTEFLYPRIKLHNENALVLNTLSSYGIFKVQILALFLRTEGDRELKLFTIISDYKLGHRQLVPLFLSTTRRSRKGWRKGGGISETRKGGPKCLDFANRPYGASEALAHMYED